MHNGSYDGSSSESMGPDMTETTYRYEQTEMGEVLVATNGRLELRWSHDAELVLLDPAEPRTRVAGGPLFELAPQGGSRTPLTVGLGLDETGAGALDPVRFLDSHGPGVRLKRLFPVAVQPLIAEWTVSLYDEHAFARVEVALRNTGSAPIAVRRIFPYVTGTWWGNGALRLAGRDAHFDVYKNGWQSWSYAGGLPDGTADPRPQTRPIVVWHSPGGPDPRQPVSGIVDAVSEGVAMLGHADQREALMAGFLSAEEWLGQMYAQRMEGAFAACALLDDFALQPGETVTAPPVALALGPQDQLLSEYAAALAREQHARAQSRVPTGWCSWYYYYSHVSADAISENLTALRSLRGTLPVEVALVDDGYETTVGDWLSISDRFPDGMGTVVDQIRGAGFEPGIWVAPFTVAANSQLAKEHPNWLIHDRRRKPVYGGHNWDSDLYGLDTSHPEAREWLRQVFTTIVEDWGFRVLKLDFLVSAALLGHRHDPGCSRARAVRDGLALIREIVGDDVFILGCGCPLLSAVGIVDAMRIGPDTAPYWPPHALGAPKEIAERHAQPQLEGAIRNTLTRAWMQPALWTNDPDCLIVRDQLTELTVDEIQMFASAVGLTGGMVLDSDRLSQLSLERLGIVSRLLPPMPERALPSNYFDYGIPERVAVHVVRTWGQWLLLGLFNGEEQDRELTVRWSSYGLAPGEYHAVEFWSGAYLGLSAVGVTVRVARHTSAVLAIRRDEGEPQLLSTSFHISQGGTEIADWRYDAAQKLAEWDTRIGRQASGTFTLWLPKGLRPKALHSTATTATWQRNGAGEVIVTAEIRDDARFTLELE